MDVLVYTEHDDSLRMGKLMMLTGKGVVPVPKSLMKHKGRLVVSCKAKKEFGADVQKAVDEISAEQAAKCKNCGKTRQEHEDAEDYGPGWQSVACNNFTEQTDGERAGG